MEITMDTLIANYSEIRQNSQNLCTPLLIDDYNIQPRSEVSPPKWHLAHTTWFFETFILKEYLENYTPFHPQFDYIFNSYYKGQGEHWDQSKRGRLSRPSVDEIYKYRAYVDTLILEFFNSLETPNSELSHLIKVGLHHEQQHQELLLMDIKAIFGSQALKPEYKQPDYISASAVKPIEWIDYKLDTTVTIGAETDGFKYDNEIPQFLHHLNSFSIADRYITNTEYKEFIEDGGYSTPSLWLSLGWDWVEQFHIQRPLYWSEDLTQEFTLYGDIELAQNAPVSHISYYEAEAFAKWAGRRLPTEFEMEHHLKNSTQTYTTTGVHSFSAYEPGLWCWTSSHYSPYPGFKEFNGKLSEYNGKFMCNQFVLKGGCFATPKGHLRPSYRNFYAPQQRWMFSGIKLAKDQS